MKLTVDLNERLPITDNDKTLGKRRNVTRQKSYYCNMCNDIFVNRFSLEDHMVKVHAIEKEFKCQICSHTFLKEWRYSKHMKIHEMPESIRKCHYFNNGLECPYVNSGCKFQHEISKVCKFRQSCKRTMCIFRH